MIKEIEPQKLSVNLWRTGPYIYFFETQTDNKNKFTLASIDFLTKKYPKLNVLVINWEKQVAYNSCIPKYHKNTIFLYYKGKCLKEVYEPKKKKLEELFKQGMECYKERLQIGFTVQGSLLAKDPSFENIISFEETKKDPSRRLSGILYRKKRYAKIWNELSRTEQGSSNTNFNSALSNTFREQNFIDIKPSVSTIEKYPINERIYVRNLVREKLSIEMKPLNTNNTSNDYQNQNLFQENKTKTNNYFVKSTDSWFKNVVELTAPPKEIFNKMNKKLSTEKFPKNKICTNKNTLFTEKNNSNIQNNIFSEQLNFTTKNSNKESCEKIFCENTQELNKDNSNDEIFKLLKNQNLISLNSLNLTINP